MWSHMLLETKRVGFGLSEQEAEHDLYVNQCRESLEYDVQGIYKKRRLELSTWFPKENMLHITGMGCLMYEKERLTELKTGRSVQMAISRYGIFRYFAELFGDLLSYEDIVVCLQEEVSLFFLRISDKFLHLREYPIVKVAERSAQFNPDVIYTLRNGVIIGEHKDKVGMKVIGDEQYHLVELEDLQDEQDMLAYLSYRLGLSFKEGGIGLWQG